MKRSLSLLALALAAGCNGNTPPSTTDGSTSACTSADYPPGPYGTMAGDIIANIQVRGVKRDDNGSGSPADDKVRSVCLSDYRDDKSLKVLAIMIAAEWCAPCKEEQPELITTYADYKMKNAGVAMLESIGEKVDHTSADEATINRWADAFTDINKVKTPIPFDLTYDQSKSLARYGNSNLYPSELVVRLSDMSIEWKEDGYHAGAVKAAIDSVLAPK